MQPLTDDLLRFNGVLFTTVHMPAGHSPLLDALMPLLANDLVYFFPLLILLLWWIPGGTSPQAHAERSVSHETVVWAVAAAALALLGTLILGALVPEPRPFLSFHFTPLISHAPDASFPSDHAALSFALTSVLLLRFWLAARRPAQVPTTPALQRRITPETPASAVLSDPERTRLRWRTGLLAGLGLVMALAIGYARVYVGVHYPLDILGGAIVGFLAALLVAWVRQLFKPVARLVENGVQRIHLT